MLVEKHEEQSGQKVGGYSMDELNRMVEAQELEKQYKEDMKEKRRKRRKRLYGEDYVDPDDIEEEVPLQDDSEPLPEQEMEARDEEYNHEEL